MYMAFSEAYTGMSECSQLITQEAGHCYIEEGQDGRGGRWGCGGGGGAAKVQVGSSQGGPNLMNP